MKPTQRLEIPVTPEGCKTLRGMVDNAELNAQFSPEVVAHCQHCTNCQKYSQQLSSVRGLVANQVRVAAPADFDIKLRQRIAASRQSASTMSWWQMMMRPAFSVPTMAAVIMAFLVGTYIQSPSNQTTVTTERAGIQSSNQISRPSTNKPGQPEGVQKPGHVDSTMDQNLPSDPDSARMMAKGNAPSSRSATPADSVVGGATAIERGVERREPSASMMADSRRMDYLRRGTRDGDRVNITDLDARPRPRGNSSAPSMTVVYGARPVITTVDSDAIDGDHNSGSRDEPTIF